MKVNNTVDQRPRNVVNGVEEFLRQKLSGQGLAFIIAGGSGIFSSTSFNLLLELLEFKGYHKKRKLFSCLLVL